MPRSRNSGKRRRQQQNRNARRAAKKNARLQAEGAAYALFEKGAPNLRQAITGEGLSSGQRALHMLAYTEEYLPGRVGNFFNKSPGRLTAGKYLAEAFGWGFSPGSGPAGQNMTRYMGESQGWLGSKLFAKHGFKAFKPGMGLYMSAGFGAFSLGYTANLMYEGYQNDGLTGAAMGLGESVAWAYGIRTLLPTAFNSTIAGATTGWGAGSFLAGSIELGSVANMGFAVSKGAGATKAAQIGWGARAAMFAGGGLGAGIGAAVGTLINPYAWAIMGGIYATQKVSEAIDRKSRAGVRQKQVRALELGTPMSDQFGTISTLRQRSLSAIQNSHVNGRMALGNEAALLHTSF